MAAGKPLLAICEAGNDTARVILDAQCGERVAPGDGGQLALDIRRLKENRNKLRHQGMLARAYFDAHFSALSGMRIYEQVFSELIRAEPPEAMNPANSQRTGVTG